jgi:hypothetical protein
MEDRRMRLVLSRCAARIGNRVPETIAVVCWVIGLVACVLIWQRRLL